MSSEGLRQKLNPPVNLKVFQKNSDVIGFRFRVA